MRTKRIVALIAALLLAAVVSWSQNARVKDIRQTYLWDVTLSMKGKPKSNPNIWEPVKKALIADIQAIPDESTEIVVIPFQHKALDTWRAPATEAGKAAMIKRINAYDIPLEYVTANGKRTTMTFLGPPLEYCLDNIFTDDKIDILKFMTDGVDEQDQVEPQNAGNYKRVLARWCEVAKKKDVYGYYIILNEAAQQGRIVLEQVNPCRFSDVTVKDDIDLTFVTLIPQESMAFNIRDDYGKPVKVKFSHSGNGVVPDGYRVRITSWSNSYMQVDQVVTLHGNTAEVNPKYLMSKQEMADALPTDHNEVIYFQAEAAEGMDEEPFCRTSVLSNPTACELINKPEMSVKFHVR